MISERININHTTWYANPCNEGIWQEGHEEVLTPAIILEHLDGCELVGELNEDVRHRWIKDATPVALFDETSVAQGWLHVASLQEARKFHAAHPEALALGIVSQGSHEEIAGTACNPDSTNLMVIRSGLTVKEVYLQIRTLFSQMNSWFSQVHAIYRNRGGYQDVLEASESIVGNLVTLSNSAYRLIAHTPDISTTDDTEAQLIANGHHSPEVVKRFDELGLPQIWRNSESFIDVLAPSPVCKFESLAHVFRFRQSYFLHLVMICERKPVTDALIDLFNLLIRALEPFVERDWDAHKGFAQPHDQLFEKLLNAKRPPDEDIAREASLVGMPLASSFELSYIEAADADELGIDAIAWLLVELFPERRISVYQDAILILDCNARPQADGLATSPSLLDVLLERSVHARIGASSAFDSLTDLDLAYRQAAFACSSVKRKRGTQGIATGEAHFDDLLASYVLKAFSDDVRMARFCTQPHPVALILNADAKRNTRIFELLKTYLELDCRASSAADKLGMHRNNVVYHIERIEERYGLKLDDPDTKFEALMVIRLLEDAQRLN